MRSNDLPKMYSAYHSPGSILGQQRKDEEAQSQLNSVSVCIFVASLVLENEIFFDSIKKD